MTSFISFIIFYLIVSFGILKGLRYIYHLVASIRFLRRGSEIKKNFTPAQQKTLPEIIIALPVLREQRVLEETLTLFSKFQYPKEKFKIIVVTTEKELSEKRQKAKKLSSLAQDMGNNLSREKILEKYLGVFPKNRLENLIKKGRNIKEQKKLLALLKKEYEAYPTTIKLARELIPRFNSKMGWECFYHLHYPQTFGVMSHQLNFVAKKLTKILKRKIKADRVYFGVYNADSAPSLKTLIALGTDALSYYQKNKRYPEVYQQIAAYVKNFASYSETPKGYLLQASSIVQTRWALGSEIPMLRKHSNFWEKRDKKLSLLEKLFKEPSAYCVGHGLFIRYDILQNIGYFPDETMNEDLALGFYLCLKKIPIRPIATLENVENPETIVSLIKQKAMWFWGMIDYFDYRQVAEKKIKSIDPIRTNALVMRGLIRDTLAWLFCSPLLIYAILFPLILHSWKLGIIVFIFLGIYTILPSLLIIKYLPRLFEFSSGKLSSVRPRSAILISFFTPLYLLISSIGPWITFYQKVIWKITGEKPEKNKTER